MMREGWLGGLTFSLVAVAIVVTGTFALEGTGIIGRKYTITPAHGQVMAQGGDWRHTLKVTINGQTVGLSSNKTFATKEDCDVWADGAHVRETVEALMLEARSVDTEATLVAACVQKGQDT